MTGYASQLVPMSVGTAQQWSEFTGDRNRYLSIRVVTLPGTWPGNPDARSAIEQQLGSHQILRTGVRPDRAGRPVLTACAGAAPKCPSGRLIRRDPLHAWLRDAAIDLGMRIDLRDGRPIAARLLDDGQQLFLMIAASRFVLDETSLDIVSAECHAAARAVAEADSAAAAEPNRACATDQHGGVLDRADLEQALGEAVAESYGRPPGRIRWCVDRRDALGLPPGALGPYAGPPDDGPTAASGPEVIIEAPSDYPARLPGLAMAPPVEFRGLDHRHDEVLLILDPRLPWIAARRARGGAVATGRRMADALGRHGIVVDPGPATTPPGWTPLSASEGGMRYVAD